MSLRFPAVCGRDDQPGEDIAVSLQRHRFETGVDGDGSLTVDEAYVEDGTDGDEEHVEVRIEGDFSGDGTATGTLEVTSRWWNGQSADFTADCETGIVAWTADRPPVEGNDMVVPTAVPMSLAPAGPDLLVSSGSGEVVRIDADTGDARRLDGSAPAGSATTEADPNVPTTVATGAAAASAVAPIWLKNLAVVADGVWTVDPATGAVSRFELADGARTATIGHPLDSMAAGPDALWTVSTNPFRTSYALDKRDPATGDVLASTPVERGAIAVGPTDVWYADATLAGGRLARVDPTTLAVGEPFDVDIPVFGDDLVTTEDRVWWLDGQSLMAIQLASGRVSPVDLPSAPLAIAGDSTGVWTVHEQEAVARRIEGDRVVRTVDLGGVGARHLLALERHAHGPPTVRGTWPSPATVPCGWPASARPATTRGSSGSIRPSPPVDPRAHAASAPNKRHPGRSRAEQSSPVTDRCACAVTRTEGR